MGVILEFRARRAGQAAPPVEKLVTSIETELGLMATHEQDEDGDTVIVARADGGFLLELFRQREGNWWCQRPNGAQMDLFVKVASLMEFDVDGVEGEFYRFVEGGVELVGRDPQPDPRTFWEAYGGYFMPVIVGGGAAVIIGLLSRIFGFRM